MFQLGDIVCGVAGMYAITNNSAICEVVLIPGPFSHPTKMCVKLIETTNRANKEHIGRIYTVDPNHFKLVEPLEWIA